MAIQAKSAKAKPEGPSGRKPARKAKAADPAASPPAESGGAALKLATLINGAAERTGTKKAAARPLVEAVLTLIGESLDRGENLILPPLGRIRVGRVKEGAKARMLTLKLKRMGTSGAGAAAPLAQGDEAD